jgi:hypothetical protein
MTDPVLKWDRSIHHKAGEGFVTRRDDNQKIPVIITYRHIPDFNSIEFRIHFQTSEETIGLITMCLHLQYKGFPASMFVGCVKSLHSNDYHGIGTILLQVAIEYSLGHSSNGHVKLQPIKSSIGFYYKLGFRRKPRYGPLNTNIRPEAKEEDDFECIQTNQLIEGVLERATIQGIIPNVSDFIDAGCAYGYDMYLPPEAIETWKQKIENCRILNMPMLSNIQIDTNQSKTSDIIS